VVLEFLVEFSVNERSAENRAKDETKL